MIHDLASWSVVTALLAALAPVLDDLAAVVIAAAAVVGRCPSSRGSARESSPS